MKDKVRAAGVIVGCLIAVGPALVALLIYLPVRLPWRRDVAAIRAALARDPDDPVLQRYLADRALEGLSYDQVAGVERRPLAGHADGSCASVLRWPSSPGWGWLRRRRIRTPGADGAPVRRVAVDAPSELHVDEGGGLAHGQDRRPQQQAEDDAVAPGRLRLDLPGVRREVHPGEARRGSAA